MKEEILGTAKVGVEEKIKEPTELEKARELLAKEEAKKQEAFQIEFNALCEKHGYVLEVVSQIILKKK